MTIDERIKQLEEQVTATNQLLAELKSEREKEKKESVLEEYWNSLNDGTFYFLEDLSRIVSGMSLAEYDDNNTGHFSRYPSKDFAIMAQNLKKFNDMLLAFKWCYDRDYEQNKENGDE